MATPQIPGKPDHAAPSKSLLDSLPARTILQQLGVDILIACSIVVQDNLSTDFDGIEWGIIASLLLKTILVTIASFVMKQVRPPNV